MKKITFPTLLSLFVSLFLSQSLFATDVTWTGSSGNDFWSTSANWDTGTVPGFSDDVIIPSGSGMVLYNLGNGRAKRVTIGTGATLIILNGTKIRLISAVGIAVSNSGTLLVRGTLKIRNTANAGILNDGVLDNRGLIDNQNHSFDGLRNTGTVYNRTNGTMEFFNTGTAAENISTRYGSFLNEGTISLLAGGSGNGIVVGDGFQNTVTGSIIFEDGHEGRFLIQDNTAVNNGLIKWINSARPSYPTYLSYGSTFTNGTTGELEMDGFSGNSGISLAGNTTFENKGSIDFYNFTGASGIRMTGRMINSANASISIETDFFGISVGGLFQNYGSVICTNANYGMYVSGSAYNYGGGTMNFDQTNIGIATFVGGALNNKNGEITFENIGTYDIENRGRFINRYCGFIEGDNAIFNNNGTFENGGWLSYPTSGNPHLVTGNKIVNTGIVNDPYNRFASALYNQEARIIALVNPQAKVAYPNTFDIAAISNTNISGLYTDPDLIKYAGYYDHWANTYTPNEKAIGATVLYAKTIIQNCVRIIAIRVIGGVSPITTDRPKEHLMLTRKNQSGDVFTTKLKAYPNPSTGFFQIELPLLSTATYELQVINTQGQIVLRQQGDAVNSSNTSFDLSEYPTGLYFTRLLQNGQLIAQDKIQITK